MRRFEHHRVERWRFALDSAAGEEQDRTLLHAQLAIIGRLIAAGPRQLVDHEHHAIVLGSDRRFRQRPMTWREVRRKQLAILVLGLKFDQRIAFRLRELRSIHRRFNKRSRKQHIGLIHNDRDGKRNRGVCQAREHGEGRFQRLDFRRNGDCYVWYLRSTESQRLVFFRSSSTTSRIAPWPPGRLVV